MPDAAPGAGERATALLALWNDVDPARQAQYEDWHAREHVPERLTVPGILWALRYARLDEGGDAHVGTGGGGNGPAGQPTSMPRYLTLYGLRDPQVLQGPAYQRLLAQPTPASRAMRPALRNLTRWVCALDEAGDIASHGWLLVRTCGRSAPRSPVPAGAAVLVATRIPDAAPLPWLADGQVQAIGGDRLEAFATEGPVPASQAGATRWPRLPVG